MNTHHAPLVGLLENIVIGVRNREAALAEVAAAIRAHGNFRWVGLYKVDYAAGLVKNLTWNGPGAPEYPTFPLHQGLTGAVIAEKQSINVSDVLADSRYLTAFGSTRSEMIVPVFDDAGTTVLGTIDVESEMENAFSADLQDLLEACSLAIRPLWKP
jgi:L-methionine (R)-S-oxide reductase